MKIKFAVVGCGSIGKRHVAVLDANPEIEIVALCDSQIETARALSELYGNIPVYSSFDEMLQSIEADVINCYTACSSCRAKHCCFKSWIQCFGGKAHVAFC